MYYIEQVCKPNGAVHINVLNEGVTKGYFYRDYRKATPTTTYTKELIGTGTVYVDARETLSEALDRAGELAQSHGTVYGIDAQIRKELNEKRRWLY